MKNKVPQKRTKSESIKRTKKLLSPIKEPFSHHNVANYILNSNIISTTPSKKKKVKSEYKKQGKSKDSITSSKRSQNKMKQAIDNN